MTDGLALLRTMVGAVLADEALPTPEKIRELIDQTRAVPACQGVTNEEAEHLAREFEAVHGVTMKLGVVLQEKADFEPWLPAAKAGIDSYFWDRYRKLLGRRGFSGQVLAPMDEVTDRILGLLENPDREGRWNRRGMVVGHVQSGKTANYTGLICKAADAGYKVIVVIAGIHNNLRNQTQARIDEGFIGVDSARMLGSKRGGTRTVGVGRIDSRRTPSTFTNSLRDFTKAIATGVGIPLVNLKEPAIFVIKKNSNTLGNLLDWLREHNARQDTSSINSPMLLIDDEADNASINIKKGSDEVSRINGQIRELLKMFDRRCYVGYTATPFANIFIDPESDDAMFGEDLFPRDFIVSLDPPDNYFGPTKVFVDDSDRVVRHIDDNADLLSLAHKIDHSVTGLPESLETAVRTFIVARTIRLARGQTGQHNSMLVNASRFVKVQRQLRNEIHEIVERIRSSVRVNGAKPEAKALQDPEIAALREVFNDEYAGTCEWQDIQGLLLDSVSAVKVVEVNSRASGSLDYANHEATGLNVIAVGGFSLSRGLTLQGLIVSYFLRNSMMYDTLMQMGRWFGYRTGYDDLCRVWMQEEAEGWYAHIADSIEELREELRRMASVKATPREFGLKVRSHPDTLVVTARNKMGSSQRLVVSVGLANQFIETAVLLRDAVSLDRNRRAAVALAKKLRNIGKTPEGEQEVNGGRLVRAVPASVVVEFLAAFRNHRGALLTDTGPVRDYIRKRSADELAEWDVHFAGLERDPQGSLVDSSLGFDLVCQRRSPGRRSDEGTLLITNKQRVASRGLERVGLSEERMRRAEEEYAESIGRSPPEPINYPDRIYRQVRIYPLLVVHLLAIGTEGEDLSETKPVVAWSISFPRTDQEEAKVEYDVNTVWFKERYRDEDEDEAAGDD